MKSTLKPDTSTTPTTQNLATVEISKTRAPSETTVNFRINATTSPDGHQSNYSHDQLHSDTTTEKAKHTQTMADKLTRVFQIIKPVLVVFFILLLAGLILWNFGRQKRK